MADKVEGPASYLPSIVPDLEAGTFYVAARPAGHPIRSPTTPRPAAGWRCPNTGLTGVEPQ